MIVYICVRSCEGDTVIRVFDSEYKAKIWKSGSDDTWGTGAKIIEMELE